MPPYTDVLNFWFKEIPSRKWFRKDEKFDAEVRERFGAVYEAVVKDETVAWRATPRGRLAEVLVLDQFARNMYRGTPKAFAADPLAMKLAQEAIYAGDDKKLSRVERRFLYMPFMHSERREDHQKALWLFLTSYNWLSAYYELRHKNIIERFGRYPGRNAVLGRESTRQELEFLKTHKGF